MNSPGTLDVECQTVKGLIEGAYFIFANGNRVNPLRNPRIERGPAWIDSERYSIHAKAEGAVSQIMMRGPMMQSLLEERLNLTVHWETRQIPVYALTVTKHGLKVRSFRTGSCTPFDLFATFPPPEPAPGKTFRDYCANRATFQAGVVTVEAQGISLDEFSQIYLRGMDRPVINETGLTGKFDIHLEYAPDETSSPRLRDSTDSSREPPVTSDPTGPSIFGALQRQLGLNLRPAKRRGDFLVIDYVGRPSEN